MGWVYLGFIRRLAPVVRWRVVLAGAMGLEMLENWAFARGGRTLAYEAAAIAEEMFEMVAVVLFIDALLRQLGLQRFAVSFGPAD